MTLMVSIILFIFLVNIEDYNESLHSIPDEKIPLANFDVRSLLSHQSQIESQATDETLNDFMHRTLIILAVLLGLWSLCIYLAARLNLFMNHNGKKEDKTKGR